VAWENRGTGSSLSLFWEPSRAPAAAPPTGFAAEWDTTPEFTSSSYGTTSPKRVEEVQSVAVSFASPPPGLDANAGGYFTLSWGGATTVPLSWAATPDQVAVEVARLLGPSATAANDGVDPVLVSRGPLGSALNGYTWTITFLGVHGDLAPLRADASLLTGSSPAATVTEVRKGVSDIFPGDYTFTVQSVVVDALSSSFDPTTSLALSYAGKAVNPIPLGLSQSKSALQTSMRDALEALDELATVKVEAFLRSNAITSRAGVEWRITFTHAKEERTRGAGNIHLLRVDYVRSRLFGLDNVPPSTLGSLDPSQPRDANFGARAAVSQLIVGTAPLDVVVRGLVPGVPLYGRVTAFGAGGSSPPSAVVALAPAGQPGAATLGSAVVANDTSLAVAWGAPASSGGSAIAAYQVDWFPALPPPVLEVQTVTVSAQDGLPEVQTVSVTADAADLSGTFTLTFKGQTTGEIPWDATEAVVKAALERLPAVVGSVSVAREPSFVLMPGAYTMAPNNVVQYTGTLPWAAGTALRAHITSLTTLTVRVGSELSPYYGATPTSNEFTLLSANAVDVAASPPSLTLPSGWRGPTNVPVSVWLPGNGYVWTITFLNSAHTGDQPQLSVAAATGFTGSNAVLRTATLADGEAPLGGTFTLAFGADVTDRIAWDASADELKARLEALPSIASVDVARRANNNGFDWLVTFTSQLGDLAPLQANPAFNPSGLTGPGAAVGVSETQKGRLPEGYCARTGGGAVPGAPAAPAPSFFTAPNAGCLVVPAPGGGPGGAASGAGLRATIAALSPGVGYAVRVTAFNGFGPGAAVRVDALTSGVMPATNPLPPANPAGPLLIVLSDVALKAVWAYPSSDGGAPVTAYEVQWSAAGDFSDLSGSTGGGGAKTVADGALLPAVPGVATSSTANAGRGFFTNIGALTPGVGYSVRVRAVNARGPSPWAPLGRAVTQVKPPGPPLGVTAAALSHAEIGVSWLPPAANGLVFGGDGGRTVTKYLVEWDSPAFAALSGALAGSAELPVAPGGSPTAALSFKIGGRNATTGWEDGSPSALRAGATYSVRVSAYSAGGFGDVALAGAPVVLTDRAPGAPTNMALSPVSSTALMASWALPESDGGLPLSQFTLDYATTPDFVGATRVIVPVQRAQQLLTVEAAAAAEVQAVTVTTTVTNQVQHVGTELAAKADTVQKIEVSAPPVVEEVQEVETYATAIPEVQEIESTGTRVNEVQVITTGAATRIPEVQVLRVTTPVVQEVQNITFQDAWGGLPAYTDVIFFDPTNGGNPTRDPGAYDGVVFNTNCEQNSVSTTSTTQKKFVFQGTSTPSNSVVAVVASGAVPIDIHGHSTIAGFMGAVKTAWETIMNNGNPPNEYDGLATLVAASGSNAAYVRLACVSTVSSGGIAAGDGVAQVGYVASPVVDTYPAAAPFYSSPSGASSQKLLQTTSYRGRDDIPIDDNRLPFSLEFDTRNCLLCAEKVFVRSDSLSATFNMGMQPTDFQTELGKFANVGANNVAVSRVSDMNGNRVVFTVTFKGPMVVGDMPNVYPPSDTANAGTLRVPSNGFPFARTDGTVVTVTTITNGNQLSGGSFALSFVDPFTRLPVPNSYLRAFANRQTTSAAIDWNAPAMGAGSIVEKLKELQLVRSGVTATRTIVRPTDPDTLGRTVGYEWTITFAGNDGDLPPLLVPAASRAVAVTGTGQWADYWVCDGSVVQNTYTYAHPDYAHPNCVQGTQVYGEFTLNGDPPLLLAPTVLSQTIDTALPGSLAVRLAAGIAGTNSVTVSPPVFVPPLDAGWAGGLRWKVTFSGSHKDVIGDVPQLFVGGTRTFFTLESGNGGVFYDGSTITLALPGSAPQVYVLSSSTPPAAATGGNVVIPVDSSSPATVFTSIFNFFTIFYPSSGWIVRWSSLIPGAEKLLFTASVPGPSSAVVAGGIQISGNVNQPLTGPNDLPALDAGYNLTKPAVQVTLRIITGGSPASVASPPTVRYLDVVGAAFALQCPKPRVYLDANLLTSWGSIANVPDVFELTEKEDSSVVSGRHRVSIKNLANSNGDIPVAALADRIVESVTDWQNVVPGGDSKVTQRVSAAFRFAANPNRAELVFTCLEGGSVNPDPATPGTSTFDPIFQTLLAIPHPAGVISWSPTDPLFTVFPLPSNPARPATASVTTEVEGNTVMGQFRLSFQGAVSAPIVLPPGDANAGTEAIKNALLGLRDPSRGLPLFDPTVGGVTITTDSIPNSVNGFKWQITFDNPATGGNVPELFVPFACAGVGAPPADIATSALASGSCNRLSTKSPPLAGAFANNGVAIRTLRQGNQVAGTFQLSLGTMSTGPLVFDISDAALALRLSNLTGIGPVKVTRGLPAGNSRLPNNAPWPAGVPAEEKYNTARRYVWTITFASGTSYWRADAPTDWPNGFSRAWGPNVGLSIPLLACDTSGLQDSLPGQNSVACDVHKVRHSTNPVNGYFKLCLDTTIATPSAGAAGTPYVKTSACTAPLRHDAPADRATAAARTVDPALSVEGALEALPNVGNVDVSRVQTHTGDQFAGDYTWTVTFRNDKNSPECALARAEGAPHCLSPGKVPLLSLDSATLPAGLPALSPAPASGSITYVTEGNVPMGMLTLTFTDSAVSFISPPFPVDATAEEVRLALLAASSGALPTPVKAVRVSRTPTSLHRTFSWDITFTDVRVASPWGAGNHAPLTLASASAPAPVFAPSSSASGAGTPSFQPPTITTPGSPGLGGFFTLALDGAATEPLTVAWDADPAWLRLALETVAGVTNVAVSVVPAVGVGWAGAYVDPVLASSDPATARGGRRFSVTFTRNAGTFDGGVTLPAGSGPRKALVTTSAGLTGNASTAVASRTTPGSMPIGGSFSLAFSGVASPAPLVYFSAASSYTALSNTVPTLGALDAARGVLYGGALSGPHGPGGARGDAARG
jgi:hypothetical protein